MRCYQNHSAGHVEDGCARGDTLGKMNHTSSVSGGNLQEKSCFRREVQRPP